jgi:hypothetical protein
MNLTVGPLPPAVYWRRRAIVLGGLLVVILLLVYSCSGSSTSASGNKSKSPAAGPTLVPSATSSGSPSAGVGLQPSVPPSSGGLTPPVTPSATASTPGVPATGTGCTDREMKVFPTINSTSPNTSKLQYGGTFELKLNVKNISDRTCTRDVGAIAEELYIMRGKTKIWSSDDCGPTPDKPHDERTFQAGVQIYADVKWSSYDITTHDCTPGTTPAAIGSYQLFARVGSKVSDPLTFKIES